MDRSMKSGRPLRFSFGMIVFNGEDFLQEVLESIYEFAYEIIVVEGADRNARSMAGPDGRSTDGTLAILKNFPDPLKKLKIIHGSWASKDEQCNRFIEEASGDYIWQVDDDEVYKKEDLRRVEKLLLEDPEITAVAFQWRNFFKGFDRVMVADEPYEVWRLFRLGPGYRFQTHRPPTVVDPATGAIMNRVKPLSGRILADMGIRIYHYSYVFDRQVKSKIQYHANLRLDEQGIGIPPLPAWLSKQAWIAERWKAFWCVSWLRELRRRKDTGFHYDYYDRIWLPWDRDALAVETRYGVSPSPGPYRRTEPFLGTHPEVIARRLRAEAV